METMSLQTLCEQVKIVLAPGHPSPEFSDPGAHHYQVRLEYKGRKAGPLPFHTGSGWKEDPKAYDVMDCLLFDASLGSNTFDDFCAELGYDTDSRKALESYLECQKTDTMLRKFLGADFDAFQYAER